MEGFEVFYDEMKAKLYYQQERQLLKLVFIFFSSYYLGLHYCLTF